MLRLQSLNIHERDLPFVTHVMSYVLQMISVERVIEYTDLEKEAPWKYFFHRLPPAWPHEGKIFFQNINLRYSLDGPLVLKDLTAVINSREKVCLSHLPL